MFNLPPTPSGLTDSERIAIHFVISGEGMTNLLAVAYLDVSHLSLRRSVDRYRHVTMWLYEVHNEGNSGIKTVFNK